MAAENKSSLLPWLTIVLGVLTLLVGVFAGPVSQWLDSGAPVRLRIPLVIIGCVLIAVGVLRHRVSGFYRESVLMVANTALLLLVLEFLAGIALSVFSIGGPAINEPTAQSGEIIAPPDMLRQKTQVKHARFVSWLGTPQETDTLSIDEHGLRVTPFEPSDASKKPLKLFAFGGSTMWGEGVADNETIASYLQQELSRSLDYPVQVTNFGQRGWVSTQNLTMLLLQLQQGNVPDVVVFYDGYNDTYAPNSGARPGYPEDFDNLESRNAGGVASLARTVQSLNITRLLIGLTGLNPKPAAIDVPTVSQEIVNAYLNVFRMTGGLANEYGFARQFFWQPQLLTDTKPLTPFEQQIRQNHPWNSDTVKQLTHATYGLMEKEIVSRPELSDLTHALAGVADPVYFDPCHMLPVGNLAVAKAMMASGLEKAVRARLAQLQRN